MKKIKILTITLLLILLFTTLSFASYSTVTMSVVEEPVCTIQIGENSKFEKKLIEKNLSNKEVTLQLQVTNEETPKQATGEIMLVIDNSNSMTLDVGSNKTRKDLVFESAKTLVSNLMKDNNNLKIGIVSFSSNSDVSKEGTLEDASLASALTSDTNALLQAISGIEANGPRTDLDAGISLANQQFGKNDKNKYIIVLTDGVPNISLEHNKPYYSDDVINTTKSRLKTLNQAGVNIITMLTGIDDPDHEANDTKTFGQIITEIFGTTQNPTAGTFYYITDDKIEKTIIEDIYNLLVPPETSYKNIKVVDYFPKEIIDNFDFSYVSKANIGEISAKVDTANNSITWTIPELKVGQTAVVQYKLKLKENFDSSIVDKLLDTNQKVDLTYTDLEAKAQSKTSDVTPVLKLVEPPPVLPKAGNTTLLIVFFLIAGIATFSAVRLTIINKNTKS